MTGSLTGERPHAPRARLLTAFAAVYLLWGSTFLAMRFGILTIPPFLMAAMRHLLAGTCLIAVSGRRLRRWPTRREWRDAMVVGVLLLGANGLVAWSELHVASGTAALLVATVPLWMVLMDWLRPGGMHPGRGVLAGTVLGFAGLITLVGPGALLGHSAVNVWGAGALLLGSVSWAAGSIVAQRQAPMPVPLLAVGMQMICGGAALLLVAVLTGEVSGFSFAQVSGASWLGWAYLVVCGSLLGFTAYAYLLRATTAARVATYAYVNPIIAVVLGWAFAGEVVTSRTVAAAAVILTGVAIITAAHSAAPGPVLEEGIGD